MDFRTDLAVERHELLGGQVEGTRTAVTVKGNTKTTVVEIMSDEAEEKLGKPKGKYITVELPHFSSATEALDERLSVLSDALRELLPENGAVLFAGLGNSQITPDALGPKTAAHIFTTRHLSAELQKELGFSTPLREVSSISTGVLGQTGIESAEIVKSIADEVSPDAVIAVDALSARRLSRLGCTVQLSNTGIAPGSGIGNRRVRLNKEFLGVPVIGIGVPTVVSAVTLAGEILGETDEERLKEALEREGADMVVTPKDMDEIINNASYLLGLAVNRALQPSLTVSELLQLA